MDNYITPEKLVKDILFDIDDTISKKYQSGILKNIIDYIKNNYHDAIVTKEGKVVLDKDVLGESFSKDYLQKQLYDYSALDLAVSALRHFGLPHEDEMSIQSLEKKILSLMDSKEYIDKVYIKRSQGGHNTKCLSHIYVMRIPLEPEVKDLIDKQIKKAEARNIGSNDIDWLEYENEKAQIEEWEEPQPNIPDSSHNLNPSQQSILDDEFIDKLTDIVVEKVLKKMNGD